MDDLYPNDGKLFTSVPDEQTEESEREEREVLSEFPLIQDVIKRLEDRIEFYHSVDSIPNELYTKPDEFMHAVAANRLTRDNLSAEKTYLEGLVDEHVKKR